MNALNEHQRQLVSAAVDGELSPQERAEYEALIEQSAAARELRAELLKLGNLIESLPEREPPADLAERILARAAPSNVTPIRPAWRRAQLPLAFAAGLLVAVTLQRWLPHAPTPAELARMSGTLAPAAHVARGDSRTVAVDGLQGRVTFGRTDGIGALDVALTAPGPFEVEIGLAGTGLGFGGVVSEGDEGGLGNGRIEFAGGTVRVVGDGAAGFRLLLPVTADVAGGAPDVVIRTAGAERWRADFAD